MDDDDHMILDIRKHFRQRLNTLLQDTVSTCEIADVPSRKAVAMLSAEMMYEIVGLCDLIHVSEAAFMEMCNLSYRKTIDSNRMRVAKARAAEAKKGR